MFFHRIQMRLIFLFVGLVVSILFAAGWTLEWMTRQSLETELGRKLEAVAGAASVMYREEEMRILLSGLGPRTAPYFREPLSMMKKITEVKRITFFNVAGENLLDSEKQDDSRIQDFGLRFYRREMDAVRQGEKAHSILFKGIDGLPTMTGFSPLFLDGEIVGGVGVDGSVPFLGAVENLKHRLIWIGLVGSLIAAAGAVVVAASFTRPIRSLVASSIKIGEGQMDEPIYSQGKSEIALLAKTMEEMRKGLADRERELKIMLASVAHEIRNPLGGIELFAGLLSDEVSGLPQAKIQVDRILKEVRYLKQIVDSFLDYARPQEPKKENMKAGSLVRETVLLLAEEADRQKVSFSIEPALDTLVFYADINHFKRAALNLLQNALLAMPQGGVIRIRGEETSGMIRLYFEDTGQGIPKEIRENVFTPFFTTREKGTGLGLSIVKKLLEVNGGTVELVRSGPEGTEFCVTLEKGKLP